MTTFLNSSGLPSRMHTMQLRVQGTRSHPSSVGSSKCASQCAQSSLGTESATRPGLPRKIPAVIVHTVCMASKSRLKTCANHLRTEGCSIPTAATVRLLLVRVLVMALDMAPASEPFPSLTVSASWGSLSRQHRSRTVDICILLSPCPVTCATAGACADIVTPLIGGSS